MLPFLVRIAVPLVVLGLAALPSRANEARSVRIDLSAEKDELKLVPGAVSEGASAKNSAWRKEKQDYWITAVFPSAADKWLSGSITFTPQGSGRVLVMLKGPYVRVSPGSPQLRTVWAYFDEVLATGATVRNPGFEELQGERPAVWYRLPPPAGVNLQPETLADIDSTQPAEGRFSARVWHHSGYAQAIEVQAGVPVTITFRHRLHE